MPEEIKKVIIVCVSAPAGSNLVEETREKKESGLGRLLAEGTLAQGLSISNTPAAATATLFTAASFAKHGVEKAGTPCRAEYVWESAQRSSKKTALFGFAVDRQPEATGSAADPGAISSFLRTSPDWDLGWVQLGTSPGAESAIAEILGAADEETLSVVVGLPGGGGEGFFALAGPGIKKGAVLSRKAKLEDVVPTLCYLAEICVPADCEGGILYQALEDPDMKIKELRACRRNYERLKRSMGPSVMC